MLSPSARKVWIEIKHKLNFVGTDGVTFRKEGVDWNSVQQGFQESQISHLPQGRCGLKFTYAKRGADNHRHLPQGRCGLKLYTSNRFLKCHLVTFRKEGVDWNRLPQTQAARTPESPSARKVWIEISIFTASPPVLPRHLPQGRCGLKYQKESRRDSRGGSPSARKVWIEIGIWS